MEDRYREFRRMVLLARNAYAEGLDPKQMAGSILAAARELVALKEEMPAELFSRVSRCARPPWRKAPGPDAPELLLASSRILFHQAQQLQAGSRSPRWLGQAYRVLWYLDWFLVGLAAGRRERPVGVAGNGHRVDAVQFH